MSISRLKTPDDNSVSPRTNEQAERYNKIILARLRHFVSGHQRDWDFHVHPLKSAYNTQVHQSTGVSWLGLVLSRHLPWAATFDLASIFSSDLSGNVSFDTLHNRLFSRLALVGERVKNRLTAEQNRYKYDHDKACARPRTSDRTSWFL